MQTRFVKKGCSLDTIPNAILLIKAHLCGREQIGIPIFGVTSPPYPVSNSFPWLQGEEF